MCTLRCSTCITAHHSAHDCETPCRAVLLQAIERLSVHAHSDVGCPTLASGRHRHLHHPPRHRPTHQLPEHRRPLRQGLQVNCPHRPCWDCLQSFDHLDPACAGIPIYICLSRPKAVRYAPHAHAYSLRSGTGLDDELNQRLKTTMVRFGLTVHLHSLNGLVLSSFPWPACPLSETILEASRSKRIAVPSTRGEEGGGRATFPPLRPPPSTQLRCDVAKDWSPAVPCRSCYSRASA